ncbi:MAG: FG-GAP-like repeat-containing protein [Myxococcaceae bacterium]|nr:FG-GAP-like repeat-containing protein [Myxococcaceae bacterium]
MRSIPVFFLLLLALAGCPGERPPCNASTCAGCCTQTGECLAGNDKAACGREGLFCRACDEADTCSNGRCDLVRPDAGACPTGFHRCGDTCASNDDVATCGARCSPCPGSSNGRATCTNQTCGLACNTGFHACGSVCADDTSVNSCGDRCGPCAVPANATSSCTNRQCDFSCANGFHRCGDACADSASPQTCGERCTVCPAPPNGSPICVASTTDAGVTVRSCDFACNVGFHRCGSACLPDDSPNSCGSFCVPCPTTANGAATCVSGQCGLSCSAGFNLCGNRCVPETSTAACGTTCQACVAPDGGSPVCAAGQCAFTCASGFNPCNGACASATDVTACGSSCTRCPAGVPGSVPTCDGTSCSTTCAAGNTRCGGATGSCVGEGIAASCGSGCTACPGGSGLSRPTCSAGACGATCIDTTCGAACADRTRDPANCGACGTSCAGGACVDGQCRTACTSGVVFAGIAETLPHAFVANTAPRFWLVDTTQDARLDLVATAGTARLVFTNEGNARFSAPVSADAGIARLPLGVGDFTLDGRSDLLAGDATELWLVSQTSSGFQAPVQLFTNGQNGITLAADFSGDGRPDLVRVPQLGNFNADLWVNQSADGGAPFTQTRNGAPNLQQAELARAAQLNLDGGVDVVTYFAGQVRTFLSTGSTTFSTGVTAAGTQSGVVGLSTGDVTRDGRTDVVTVTTSAVFVWAGDGLGGLAAPALVSNAGTTLGSVEVADLDQDGFSDIALGTGRGLEVLWNTGPGTFTAAEVYEIDGFTSAAPASSLQLADVSGDGRLDAVLSSSQVRPVFARNGATGRGFDRTVKTALTGAEFVQVGRIDGDGRDDLVVSRRASIVSMLPITTQSRVLRASGGGAFTVGPEDALTRPEALVDFDQDGAADVLRLECPAPALPDGGFNPAPVPCFARVDFATANRFNGASVSLALDEVASEVVLRVGDVDGDGRVDLVARTRVGFWLFRNTAARQFGPGQLTPFLPVVADVAVTDVDRDGRGDLVVLVGASAPRAVFVLLGRATGFALAPRLGGFDFDSALAAGFVTNDGFPDVAGSTGAFFTGDGTGTFTRSGDWKPGPTSAGVSFIVDTDGDGRGEVVNRQFGATVLANPAVPPRGFAGRVERFADVTGDGVPDWVQVTPTDVVVGVGRCR